MSTQSDQQPDSRSAESTDGPIPLCIPEIRGNEWAYVRDCLDSGWVSSVGGYVSRFEEMLAEFVGAAHAVATVNGTAALHTALLVAGVQPDDEVLVSGLTFIAPANAIRYAGAWPVFIDAEPDTWQMDPQEVADFLEGQCVWRDGALHNRQTGRRVRAIVPVHILGHPVDMDPILALAQRYNLAVVEDASESLGARYKGRAVGTLGDVGCFSFNGNKLITTGGGGMLVTNRPELAARARYLTTQAKDDPLEYIHGEVGYNYRLTNVQAAIGCAQMENLPAYIAAKRQIAAAYAPLLRGIPGLTQMPEADWAHSAFWLYTLLVAEDSRPLLESLAAQGIQTRPLWQPLHRSPAHPWGAGSHLPVADALHRRALSLPCSVGLGMAQIERVAAAVAQWAEGTGEKLAPPPALSRFTSTDKRRLLAA